MNRRIAKLLVCGLIFAPLLAASPQQAGPGGQCEMPLLPQGSSVQLIGADVQANGLPLSVVEVRHTMSNREFVAHFRKLWSPRDQPPQFVEYPLGVWAVIAHRDAPCFFTVQVRREAMDLPTLALIGIGRPGDAVVEPTPLPPDFPAGEVLSHLHSRDDGREADTWLLSTQYTADGLARAMDELLRPDGWTPLMARASDAASSPVDSDSRVLIYQRGQEDLGIAIGPGAQGATAVVTYVVRGRS